MRLLYKARTRAEILSELIAESTLPSSKIEGTFEYDVLASNSLEFGKVEEELEDMYYSAFGMTAEGEYLTMKAESKGVIRKSASKAIGIVTITGTGVVAEGSIFSTTAGTRFITLEGATISGSADVSIEASEAGASGNVAAGTINRIPLSIPGISSVINTEATHDGYDEEDDDALRERYLNHVRLPATSGNPNQFKEWALEVTGVGAARVIRTWNGPNTVKVIIVNSNYEMASDYLIQQVYEHIEEKRAIGAKLTVVSAIPKIINIEAEIIGTINEEDFYTGITDYFQRLTQQIMRTTTASSYYVSYAQISSVILVEGEADDHKNLLINGGIENIPLENEELPVLGTVTFR